MACLHAAADEGRPVPAPVLRLPAPPVPRKLKQFLAPEQAARFFDSLRERNDRYEALWVLTFYTGNRLGECLGLRWPNVDLAGRVVTIAEALPPYPGAEPD
jgi:integrase